MKIFSTLLIFGFFPTLAFAGPHRVGNGGNGIMNSQGQVYLLDLFEAGQEVDPSIDDKVEVVFYDRLRHTLDSNLFPVDLIAQKISEIYQKDKVTAAAVVVGIESMSWSLVNYDLEKTDDLSSSVATPQAQILQLANRRYGQVMITRRYWNSMPRKHQAALVIHEIFYALMVRPPQVSEAQTNSNTRSIVGTLFSPDFKNFSTLQFDRLIAGGLPNSKSLLSALSEGELNDAAKSLMVDIGEVGNGKITASPFIEVSGGSSVFHKFLIPSMDDKVLDLSGSIDAVCRSMAASTESQIQIYSYRMNISFNLDSPGFLDWVTVKTYYGQIWTAPANAFCSPHLATPILTQILQTGFPFWKLH